MAPVVRSTSDWDTWFEDLLKTLVSHLSAALLVIDEWSINHPYLVASSLILISANPDLVLIPMRLLTKTAVYLVLLPLRLVALPFKLLAKLILWLLGFRASGVERESFASRYQSRYYGGYVPPRSTFSQFQSYGANDLYHDEFWHEDFSIAHEHQEGPATVCVRWLALIGATFVLGRSWGFWCAGSLS